MVPKKRYLVLDALRGFALLGIILANFPEFSLWTFADPASHTPLDRVVRAFQYFFIDGKFYTLFSILFGIGFSIQLANAGQRTGKFYRRMTVLFVIGLLHLLFLWSGDILMLYAAMGMLLPLFRRLPTKGLLATAGVFLVLPVISDALFPHLADPLEAGYMGLSDRYGISEVGFAAWLRDIDGYGGLNRFLRLGAVERMWEFVSSHRYFKVLGLFLIGFAIGNERMFADLPAFKGLMRKVLAWGLAVGLPVSLLYTWSNMAGGSTVLRDVFYLFSVYPMGLAYAAGFCLLFERRAGAPAWRLFGATGRMACSNYLGQSVFGILLFYGIGLGWGAGVDLLTTELIALGVYVFQMIFSHFWLKRFYFGPVEWVWRMLTYRQRLPMLRDRG
jgi:Predicted membrane protein